MSHLPISIQRHISDLKGEVGFVVHHLNTGQKWIYNDRLFLAASTIKLPIMAAFFSACEQEVIDLGGSLIFQREVLVEDSPAMANLAEAREVSYLELIHWMITVSDNTATNLVIELLRLERIQEWITSQGFLAMKLQRKMMDLQARSQGIENWTTPMDMSYFMERLIRGQLVSPEACQRMLAILYQQEDREKIPALLVPPIKVANKPGELPTIRSDVGYVHDEHQEIVLSIFCDQLITEETADEWIAKFAFEIWRHLIDL